MKALVKTSLWLLVIGGLFWGIEGITEINLFDTLLGFYHPLETLADILMGLAAILVAYDLLIKKAV